MTLSPSFSIGELSSASGLSPHALRAWERRYGFPRSHRLPSGHRRFDESDLSRLRWVLEAVSQGMRPSAALNLDVESLRVWVIHGRKREHDLGACEELFHLALTLNGNSLRDRLRELSSRCSARDFLGLHALPFLDQLEHSHRLGEVELHQLRFASEILEDELRRLLRELEHLASNGASNPRVLVGALPFGAPRIAQLATAITHTSLQFRVTLVSASLPVPALTALAVGIRADRVCVPIGMNNSGERSRDQLRELRDALDPKVRLLICGQGAKRTRSLKDVEKLCGAKAT
jgi:MerR family transcriptional regulator, light-induced transcriptional regulator